MATDAAPTQAPYNYSPISLQIGPVDGTVPISMSDVVTLLVNPTSAERTYSYLPPHGRTIASQSTLTLDGDLVATLSGNSRYSRKLNAIKNDVQNGYLHVFRNVRHLVAANVLAAQTVAVGDMLWLDTSAAEPAADFTWDTNLATTQASFVNAFLGIAVEAKGVTSGNQRVLVDISPFSTYYMTCTSETHEIGDTLGPKKASGNALVTTALVKSVAASSNARCVSRDASASTKVLVRFQSAYWGHNAASSQ